MPFLVRGPGVEPGTEPRWLTGNVDIAPTFLALAGWRSAAGETVPPQMDGHSFAAPLMGKAAAAVASTAATTGTVSRAAAVPVAVRLQGGRPNRSEYLLEFTGMTDWPKTDGPNGECPPGGTCARLNDCLNNTYRALRCATTGAPFLAPFSSGKRSSAKTGLGQR